MATRKSALCHALELHIPQIGAEYQRLTNRPPWSTLSDAEWRDHLPPLLHAMIDGAVCEGGSHSAREVVVELATKHGGQRRAVGFTNDELLQDEYVLRNAIWAFLTAPGGLDVDLEQAATDIIRIDAAMTVVTLAGLIGYHRAEIEPKRNWRTVMQDLLARWESTLFASPDLGGTITDVAAPSDA